MARGSTGPYIIGISYSDLCTTFYWVWQQAQKQNVRKLAERTGDTIKDVDVQMLNCDTKKFGERDEGTCAKVEWGLAYSQIICTLHFALAQHGARTSLWVTVWACGRKKYLGTSTQVSDEGNVG